MPTGGSGRYARYVRDSAAHVEPNYQTEMYPQTDILRERMFRMFRPGRVNNTPTARKSGNTEPLQHPHMVAGLQARVNTLAEVQRRAAWVDPRMTQGRRS